MARLRILYVEDNRMLRLAVKDTLEAEGWQVEVCADGATALERLNGGEQYDVLLFDNELPSLSGLELTRRARSLAHRRETPIIMLSASEVETEARLAGVNEFLSKPDDIDLIAETISRLLSTRDATDKKEGG